jgi:pentatricopeptide repeat protein
MHSLVVKNKLFPGNPCLYNAILSMYTRCGTIGEAREVFDGLPMRNVVTWNTLISGYIRQGQNHEALGCCERMMMIARDEGGIFPYAITYLCALKVAGASGSSRLKKRYIEP